MLGSLCGHRDDYVYGIYSCYWCLKDSEGDSQCFRGVGWNVTETAGWNLCYGASGLEQEGAWEGSGPSWKAGLESRGDFSKNLSAFILEVSVGSLPWF